MPPVRQHVELVERADVAQECGSLVSRPQGRDRVAQVVDLRGAPGAHRGSILAC